MKFSSLEIHNFSIVGDAKLELGDRGLLLIQGENADDTSACSNGAGKSSIVDALCWGIYGTTARGVSTDAVINRTAKKDCYVYVFIEDKQNNKRYRIHRYRKHSTFKNQVFIWEHDYATGTEVDLSKGTERETQDVINKVMGCSLDVFMAAAYAGQERMPDLPGMTDKTLKAMIEEAANVEELTEAYSVARARHTASSSKLNAALSALTTKNKFLANTIDGLASMEASSVEFESGRRDRAKAELAKIPPINAEIAKTQASLANEEELRKQVAEIDEKIKAHKEEEAKYAGLVAAASSLERQSVQHKVEARNTKQAVDQLKAELADVQALVGTPCKECGKAYCDDDLHSAVAARSKTIVEKTEALRESVSKFKASQELVAKAQNAAATFKAGMSDVSDLAMRHREASDALNQIEIAKVRIKQWQKQIESIKEAASVKMSEGNVWTVPVERCKEQIEKQKQEIAADSEAVAKMTAEVELLANAVKVFGPAGVRAHILDTVTPFLNERTHDYLGALSDGNIHATWTTLTKNAKGELREKFSIEVTNDKGGNSFAELSGGEKRKVRLATMLALQDMVASRATKPIDIFIGDEIDHALDEAGLERLMTLLERKARERGTVLVISHNSLSDWCSNVITATKSGGYTTISGATQVGF